MLETTNAVIAHALKQRQAVLLGLGPAHQGRRHGWVKGVDGGCCLSVQLAASTEVCFPVTARRTRVTPAPAAPSPAAALVVRVWPGSEWELRSPTKNLDDGQSVAFVG